MRKWDWGKTARLAVYVVLAFGVGVGAAVSSLETDGTISLDQTALIGAAYLALRVGSKWFKLHYAGEKLEKILCALLVASVALSGCASVGTKTSEAITNPDGTSYAFSYQGKSTAAPFGKVDATVHRMAYQTEDGANLTVGQDAQGLDNTGQVAAISAMGEILGQTIAALLKGGILAPATPEAVDTGGILGKLNTRLEELDTLIERLRAMGVIKEGAIIRPQPVLALPHN